MKITSVDVIRVALPFESGRAAADGGDVDTFNAADRSLRKMESLLVKVTDDSGRIGWGEAFGHLINPVTFAALAGSVGRWFLNRPFEPTEESLIALRDEADRAFHPFGRTGPVVYALSAIDIALYDLAAQANGLPVHRWLGAKRDEIDVYASLVSYDNDPTEVARHVRRAWSEGFRKIKLHETERPAIVAAREALPSDSVLMVDVNCPWTAQEAKIRVSHVSDIGLGWIEEPVWPCDDLGALARLRGLGTPIAGGENASGVGGFREAFARNALDIAQPSIAKIGGFTGVREVIALGAKHDVQVIPHCFYYGAGLLATAHVVACLPDDVALEIPWLEWPEKLHAAQRPGPRLQLPNVPGLGFMPDLNVLNRHIVEMAHVE
ncbi:mandelate racemase/muconate lactonizing enzyme family protein [Paraburkholderia tropica]|uniref:mandelate racemase/muconate lactonizing enzyme family protein n=1 Tax=Paraburkholderia tropica TaxID=92647 RepID=UPI00159278AC|nr:mandelate racemase/muconate lactonizing enzyme family protein [Paraburkholderia tropica]